MDDKVLDVLRTEKKYPMSYVDAKKIINRMDCVMHRDIHGGHEGYLVRSLYFDTINDDDYKDKDGGLELRRKIRLRVYGSDDEVAKLELKEKQGDLQRKRSLLVYREDAKELCKGNYDVLKKYDTDFANEMYGRMCSMQYMPKSVVEYNRLAYVVDTNNIRITFDSQLRANEVNFDIFDPDLYCYPVGKLMVTTMEVKYDHFLLEYVKNLVSMGGFEQVSASKYYESRCESLG